MVILVIKTQKDLDNLQDKFNNYTCIEIRSTELIAIKDYHTRDSSRVVARDSSHVVARGSSHVEARGSSHVEAWGSSRVVARESSHVVARESSHVEARYSSHVEAWDSSHVVAWGSSTIDSYLFSVVFVMSSSAKIKKLYDKSTAKFYVKYDTKIIQDKHKTAQIVEQQKELSFETYLERGWVKADGLIQRLISKKKLGSLQIFTVENWKQEKSYVIKKLDVFSHGETIEKAKKDLKYKIGNRDASKFKKWKLYDIKKTEEFIEAYRVITGACEFGVKDFCQKQGKLKAKYKLSDIFKMTEGLYGADKFMDFFK